MLDFVYCASLMKPGTRCVKHCDANFIVLCEFLMPWTRCVKHYDARFIELCEIYDAVDKMCETLQC